MLRPTRLDPDDPYLAMLGLPSDREWFRFVARGGIDLPWDIGRPWPRKFDWSGIGTRVETAGEGTTVFPTASDEDWHVQLWVQHIGDPREAVYLEAQWHPEEGRNRIALHGLEADPSDALISSAARARGWFAPIERAGTDR
jgi:hypothetical protein